MQIEELLTLLEGNDENVIKACRQLSDSLLDDISGEDKNRIILALANRVKELYCKLQIEGAKSRSARDTLNRVLEDQRRATIQ